MLQVQLLGGVQVLWQGEPVHGLHQPRLQALLAYLLLHAGSSQPRTHLAALFWPDSSEANAHTNLRTLLHRLRQTLPDTASYVSISPGAVEWREDAPGTVDVLRFMDAIRRALAARDPSSARLARQEAVEIYSGDLLPGFYDDWVLAAREALRNQQADALAWLADDLEQQRNYRDALVYAQQLLRHDPLQEAAYRRVIHLHLLNGDRAAALRAYHECAAMLRNELDVPPSPATEELHRRLLRLEEQGEASVPTTTATLSLVGRRQEWQHVSTAWQGSLKGQARLLLILGEAGIGKTRLAEELADKVRRQGIMALYTRAYAAHGAATYAPLADLLRSPALRQAVAGLEDTWRVELARLLPELLDGRLDLPGPLPMTEAWQRQRFHTALVRACLAAGQPLLLHFDDLQWCDAETLDWLHFLLRAGPRAKLLIVGTARSEELGGNHPLSKLQLALRRDELLDEIRLTPLDAEESAELAQQVTGEALDTASETRLFRATEGNPLFVIEMARAGLDEDHGLSTPANGIDLPPKVYAVLQTRLSLLSPEAQRIAELAAVIGRSFTYDVLREASAAGEDDLLDRLDELWQRHIIRERGEDAYDFSHDRIREVAYAGLNPTRRRVLHRRVADALEKLYAGQLDEASGILN